MDNASTPAMTQSVKEEPITLETGKEPATEKASKLEQSEKILDKVLEEPELEDISFIGDDYLTNPLWYEIINYFGVPQNQWENAKNDIVEIARWAAGEIKSVDFDKILLKIKDAESNLYDKPQWGESRYKALYRYIRLASKKQSIERAMSAFEKQK